MGLFSQIGEKLVSLFSPQPTSAPTPQPQPSSFEPPTSFLNNPIWGSPAPAAAQGPPPSVFDPTSEYAPGRNQPESDVQAQLDARAEAERFKLIDIQSHSQTQRPEGPLAHWGETSSSGFSIGLLQNGQIGPFKFSGPQVGFRTGTWTDEDGKKKSGLEAGGSLGRIGLGDHISAGGPSASVRATSGDDGFAVGGQVGLADVKAEGETTRGDKGGVAWSNGVGGEVRIHTKPNSDGRRMITGVGGDYGDYGADASLARQTDVQKLGADPTGARDPLARDHAAQREELLGGADPEVGPMLQELAPPAAPQPVAPAPERSLVEQFPSMAPGAPQPGPVPYSPSPSPMMSQAQIDAQLARLASRDLQHVEAEEPARVMR